MLFENDLRELSVFTSPDPVLSVYLSTDPTEGNADAYRLRLRNLLKGINLPQDLAAVERYFSHEYEWTGRSVAVFSCAARNFFRAFPLAVPVRDQIRILDRVSVKPLADLFDLYGGYGVVLVDKQGARVFFFHLGELQEQEGVIGETVKHTKHGGASTFPGRRGGIAGQTHYDDEVVDRNMKTAVEFSTHFFEEKHVRRILIGGTDENVNLFRSLLPKAWQSLVMGTFAMSMTASHAEVLARAMQAGEEAETRRETRLVDDLITAASKGNGASIGMEDTLSAVKDGRVKTLVLLEGLRKSGYRCREHSMLTTDKARLTATCGDEVERIPDVVDLAISTVMGLGGDIEVVRSHPGFDKAGGIGAYLRY